MSVTLTLPYPPTVNNLYATVFHGSTPMRVPTTEAKRYKRKVKGIAERALMPLLLCPVRIDFVAFRPRRVGDLDGMLKAVLDALTGIAYKDDGQIDVIFAMRFDDKNNPRVEITIGPSDGDLST